MKSNKTGLATNLDLVLPIEIWHECFTYLPIADHKKLSLTCRRLNHICLPFIFETISYACYISCSKHDSSKELKGQVDSLQKNIEALETLAKSPKHAPLIKKCALSCSLHIAGRVDKKATEKAKKSYALFIDTFVKRLPRFVNLKEVEVTKDDAEVEKRVLTALAGHPSLEALSFMGVRFGVHVLQPPIRVRRLSIRSDHGMGSYDNSAASLLELFSGEKLESLRASTAAYSPQLFRALMKQGILECLKHLSVSIKRADLPDLYAFLLSCPNVEFIQMSLWGEPEIVAFPPPPHSAVPLLRSFSGPATAARVFIPGRPVKKVEIAHQYYDHAQRLIADLSQLLLSLSQSTGPVIELHIRSREYAKGISDQLVSYFPSLEVLTLAMEIKAFLEENWDDSSESGTEEDESTEDENGGYVSVCASAYEDPIGGGHDLNRKSHFCYVHAHTDYMNFINSVVRKEIKLPPTIKSLFLDDDLYIKFYDGVPKNNEKETEYVKKHGEPYTATMAQDMLTTLSESYPALQSVIIGKNWKGGLKWVREDDGRWTYGTAFSLASLQASLIPDNDDLDLDSEFDSEPEEVWPSSSHF